MSELRDAVEKAIQAMRRCDRDRVRLLGDGQTTVDPISYDIERAAEELRIQSVFATPAPVASREGWPSKEKLEEMQTLNTLGQTVFMQESPVFQGLLRMALSALSPAPTAPVALMAEFEAGKAAGMADGMRLGLQRATPSPKAPAAQVDEGLLQRAEETQRWLDRAEHLDPYLESAVRDLIIAAVATPKPVEAPAQTGSEWKRCPAHQRMELDDRGCMDCLRLNDEEPTCSCGHPLPCRYPGHVHAPKPTPDAQAGEALCAVCGWEKAHLVHKDITFLDRQPFTPAPKEQRP